MHSTALRLIFFLVLTVFCLGSNEWDNVYVNDVPGKVNIIVETANTPRYGLKPAEAAAFHANLRRLRDLLMAQPMINSPLGVDILGWIRANGGGQVVKTAPVRGDGYCNYYPYVLDSKTKQPGRMIASVWTFNIYINDPAGAFEMDGKLFYEPKPAGQINGFPMCRTSQSREIIILSSTDKPLWFPLTREEYIQHCIQGIEKELANEETERKRRSKPSPAELAILSPKDRAEIEKVLNDSRALDLIKERLKRHQEALARMSPQERAAQAQNGDPGNGDYLGPQLAPLGKAGIGPPYVKVNPDWLEPSRPRSDLQLIIVGFSYGNMDADHPKVGDDGCAADMRLWETLHKSDWKAISGALAK
jgi:hypothetical protein